MDPIFYFDMNQNDLNWVLFEGIFVTGSRHGPGILYFKQKYKFVGIFKNDSAEGPGTITYPNEDRRVIGIWNNNKLIKVF